VIKVEPDEEDSDRRKMVEIQNRIEARKVARDLEPFGPSRSYAQNDGGSRDNGGSEP